MRALACALLVAACGGTAEPTQRAGTGISPTATQARAGDLVVAQVNGRPVWASCVEAQGPTPQAGLDACIAFELLAQEAERRGLLADPEVVEETRRALVNRTVEVGFEDRYRTPADMGAILTTAVERNRAWLDVPERRASAYVRFNLKPDAPAERDAHAQAVMEAFAQKLATERGLTGGHLDDLAKAQFTVDKVEVAIVEAFTKNGLAPGYRDALFEIPEIGRTSPHAVRSQWGWDVILLTDVIPAKHYTREEAATEAFPEVRRGYFNAWVDQIAKSANVRITKDAQAIAKLDEVSP